MDCSVPGFPVLHHLPEFAHTHVHWVCDAIQKIEWIHKLLKPNHMCVCVWWIQTTENVGDLWVAMCESPQLQLCLFGYQTAIPLMPCPGVYSLWATWEGARGELKICPEFAIIWSSLFRPQLTQFLDNLWWRKRTDQEWKEMDKSRQALGVCSLRLWVGSVEP